MAILFIVPAEVYIFIKCGLFLNKCDLFIHKKKLIRNQLVSESVTVMKPEKSNAGFDVHKMVKIQKQAREHAYRTQECSRHFRVVCKDSTNFLLHCPPGCLRQGPFGPKLFYSLMSAKKRHLGPLTLHLNGMMHWLQLLLRPQ